MKLREKAFDLEYVNKYASQFTIGNGFLGIRGTQEEEYRKQRRGMFAAGVYNKALGSETSDLVNLPDVVQMEIKIDQETFSLETTEILSYERYLDLKTGEVVREVVFKTATGKKIKMKTKRIAGQVNVHQAAIQAEITPLTTSCSIEISTGIDAQQTNQGMQQLLENEVRVFGQNQMAASYQTSESAIHIGIAAEFNHNGVFKAKNRQIIGTFCKQANTGETWKFEKNIAVYTSFQTADPFKQSIQQLESKNTYQEILKESADYWASFWEKQRINISSCTGFDQQVLDFSCYHLNIMTPREDSRYSVGAKGLTGEGYKGHVFWDAEIFILPFFLHHFPTTARNMLSYRFDRLEGAREKAKRNGYQGTLFPWESALSGYEETPRFAAINIKTGTRQEVASAAAEHHIVADIAYAVRDYYSASEDDVFMEQQGKQLLRETAEFWLSRASKINGRLEIHDVIGPDEYTEHINNNAYTNYLAYLNVKMAVEYQVGEEEFLQKCQLFLNQLYLPKPEKDHLIPQDDTFLQKPNIPVEKYREQAGSQEILLDYSRQEINELQVLKQADVVMLMYLLPEKFTKETMEANLRYYEKRTIHDSSLSKAIHAIVACRIGDVEWAYELFQEACKIDLGPDPHSSDEGLHAASLGAIWLAVIFGFAGIEKTKNSLSIEPKLPKAWEQLSFSFVWKNQTITFNLSKEQVVLRKETNDPLKIIIEGEEHILRQEICWERRRKNADFDRARLVQGKSSS